MKLFPALALLFSASAVAAGPALECRGVESGNRDLQYDLTVTALDGNAVVVVDTAAKEACSCKFRLSNYFDQSKGMVPGYSIHLAYQSCSATCPLKLKRKMNAHIRVNHKLMGKESYSTPFVGDEIAKCDRFAFYVPALRIIAGQAIDRMNMSEDAKRRLKALKGIGD